MISYLSLLAEAAPAGGGGGFGMFVPMILIMVLFYFVLIRPQRQQQKKAEEMRRNVAVGDKVVSIGGIHGLVSGMTDKTVSVKVADGLSLKFDRSAIAQVTDSKTKDTSSASKAEGDDKKPAVEKD